jgi:hypothetical protein
VVCQLGKRSSLSSFDGTAHRTGDAYAGAPKGISVVVADAFATVSPHPLQFVRRRGPRQLSDAVRTRRDSLTAEATGVIAAGPSAPEFDHLGESPGWLVHGAPISSC